jgi:hypothetical protein
VIVNAEPTPFDDPGRRLSNPIGEVLPAICAPLSTGVNRF